MAKPSKPTKKKADDRDFIKTLCKRVLAATAAKSKWEQDYRIGTCKAYWAGKQLANPIDQQGERKVQINRIHSAVRAAIPALYFYQPFAKIAASPARADTPAATVDERAQLLQDTANAIIRDPETAFMEQTLMALKESEWAFGCIETGYSADFVDNPVAEKPILMEKDDAEVQEPKPDPLNVDGKQLKGECFWVRRIPARQVFVSKKDASTLAELDWFGYCEWHYLEDVKRAPSWKAGAADLKPTPNDKEEKDEDNNRDGNAGDMVKVFKMWDQRSKEKYVFVEDHDQFLSREKWQRSPLHFLRFDVEPDRFYPIPPVYQMLMPQDEYNDSREFLRKLRKSTVPRYTYDKNAVDAEQMEKLESGEIGTYIPRNSQNVSPITPIEQPNMSAQAIQAMAISQQEFTELSGVSAESRRGQNPNQTATEAQIVNTKEAVQESFDRSTVAAWLSSIIRELVQLAIEKMILGKWILLNSDPFSPMFMQDAQAIAQIYKQITAEDLNKAQTGISWDVVVDVETMSPISQEQKKANWNQMLAMLANPGVASILALSPPLLKMTLNLNDIRSAKEQDMIGQALGAMMQMQQAAAAGGAPQNPGVAPMGGAPEGSVAAPPPGPPM